MNLEQMNETGFQPKVHKLYKKHAPNAYITLLLGTSGAKSFWY